MKFNFQTKNMHKYIYVTLSLIGIFWLISLTELYITISNGINIPNIKTAIAYKLLNDFWLGMWIGFLVFPLYFLLILIGKRFGEIVIKVLFVLFVLIQFSLVKYSLTTLIPLGADILGYSLKDIYITITSSEKISVLYFLPFILFPLLLLGINYTFNKTANKQKYLVIILLLVLLFGSLKLTLPKASNIAYQNKIQYLTKDIIRYLKEQKQTRNYNLLERNDYPFLKPFSETKDVLSPFFNIQKEKPTIVILIVEGLGSEFVGKNAYSGFTPYLDSLISKSLYWENFVSTSGRTFGVLPSLLASLPYGEKGFLELNNIPSHFSLISVLNANGYTTSFYSGDPSSFDKKINFLEYNGIDYIIDEDKFGSEYTKTEGNSGGFSWGYPDSEIFRKTLNELDKKKLPRLDIIMTLTNHEPFEFPLRENYLTKVDSILNSNQIFGIQKEEIRTHKNIYASLLYTDNSIKNFMTAFAKREEYNNTIFIITGDHRLIPITQKDKLCRFHVPLFIYSPMLKKAESFKSISSHLDVTPSLLSFLMNNYTFNKLEKVAWIGQGLDTAKHFRNIHQIPLMRYKGIINDFIYKDYLYSGGELFKIKENFGIYKVQEENLLKIIADTLQKFKKLNAYITQRNKIFPDSLNIYIKPSIKFSEKEVEVIKELTEGLNFDEVFFVAQENAFNKDFKKARLLCNYILNELPNHSDARTLKGRTLAWEGSYKKAEVEFLNVLLRFPYYHDSYLALLDLYWWSNQDKKAIQLVAKALENNLENATISFKLAKAHKRMHNLVRANKLMDSILKIYPENKDYITFKQSLK